MSDLSKLLSKRIDKALFDYNMIREGDRVLLGLSGGKDSLSLAYHLSRKQKHFPVKFELTAAHVRTEFSNPKTLAQISELCDSWGLPLVEIPMELEKRIQPGRRMNCFWCSKQRRVELMRYAGAHNFQRIALGHHMDDILETFFMNMSHKGELSTMLPVLTLDNYEQTIIRPLAWLSEEHILAFADEMGFTAFTCRCGFDTTSKRRNMRSALEYLVAQEGSGARERLFEALHNPKLRYLIRRSEGSADDVGRGFEDHHASGLTEAPVYGGRKPAGLNPSGVNPGESPSAADSHADSGSPTE
ncbi:MAG: tRNA 2-thiocytidine biosynthesis protein TtcA [Spirochaetaceae bacterium]|nr:MAG: tRNA 2-thiocytidine biosynthesis protein TtcA [Spirochaetaceae bacterium]